MLLTTKVGQQEVNFRMELPKNTKWIVGNYFKEFCIKLNTDGVREEEYIETIVTPICDAFQTLADYIGHQIQGKEIVLSFRYKETIGIPFMEIFEKNMNLQASWIVDAIDKVNKLQNIPYQLEIIIGSFTGSSTVIKKVENYRAESTYKTAIKDQPVQIYFNVNDDYEAYCYIKQYSVKIDLSGESYEEFLEMKKILEGRFAGLAVCIHDAKIQELILVFKPFRDHILELCQELESELIVIVDYLKGLFEELYLPYVIEISIRNV